MFVGHYAVALAADAAEPKAPLWSYVLACQLLDVGWSGLVLAGVEKLRLDPSLPGSPLDLYYMPFTHSLPGAAAISVAAALAARAFLRLPWRAAGLVGAVVFSHWLLDFLVHRPDLLLWSGVPKVGLGGWNFPLAEATLEMGLVALAGWAWVAARKSRGFAVWPGLLFLAALTAVQMISQLMPSGGAPAGFAISALAVYLLLTALAVPLGRRRTA
ncbi:hypothetical protein BH09PSE2_BH09PSE2_23160 [soil metagenome]